MLIQLLDMVNSALFNKENLENLRDRAYDLLLVIRENAEALMGQPGKYQRVVRKFEDLLHVSARSVTSVKTVGHPGDRSHRSHRLPAWAIGVASFPGACI